MIPEEDCCSESWFEQVKDNVTHCLKSKVMKSLHYKSVDLPESGKQECDKSEQYRIMFTDDTFYDFYLRNSSNGYYCGWIDFKFTEHSKWLFSEKIIIIIGLPGSWKTTFSQKLKDYKIYYDFISKGYSITDLCKENICLIDPRLTQLNLFKKCISEIETL